MEEYIDQIEKYLRGQMSHQEENNFKEVVKSNKQLRSLALIVALMVKFIRKI